MYVSDVLHACTAHIYKDFSNQQTSQKILKVVLPIIALLAISYAAFRYFYPNQPLSKPGQPNSTPTDPKATTSAVAEPEDPLIGILSRDLYNGVRDGYENHADLKKQSHRWSHPTNQGTLVLLSTGTVYPANILKFPESHTSYIMAEPPQKSEFVDWQTDFYRMVIEKNVVQVLCMDRPDAIANSSFLQNGEWLKIGEWSIQCDRGGGLMTATEQSFKISQLTISHSSQPDKTIMQFLPDEGVGGIPINMLQGVMDLSNQFMYKSMDETHPLLVTCRTGFGSSARFILLHELRARIQAFTFKYPSMGKEAIYNAFMAGRSIPEMLKQLALEIQELSTSKAAIDAVEESDIGYIEAMTKNGDKPYKDFILTAIEKASKKI